MKKRTMIIMVIVLIILVVLLMITDTARNRLVVRGAMDRFTNFTNMNQQPTPATESTSIVVPNDAAIPTNIQ